MKRKRITNALIWAIAGAALTYYVCRTWLAQGCGEESIRAAIAVYSSLTILLGALVDSKIRKAYE